MSTKLFNFMFEVNQTEKGELEFNSSAKLSTEGKSFVTAFLKSLSDNEVIDYKEEEKSEDDKSADCK